MTRDAQVARSKHSGGFALVAANHRGRNVDFQTPSALRACGSRRFPRHNHLDDPMIDKTYEPGAVEARIYEAWLEANAFAAGAGAKPGRRALLDRHPAAQRHRLAPHRPRPQQHAPGHPHPLRAHARQGRALAARHRPRRHRHPDDRRAPADGAPAAVAPRHGPRGVPRARLGVEGRERRHDHEPAQAPGRFCRLVARTLHHGRERRSEDQMVRAVTKVFVELYKRA